ncbi:MAG: HNH endonuclease [Microcoleus sp. PH2017_10_PVI_O_A]|uniref:HNH endonuclease n=1 Tax=unclassified Microcoleus TaxID=2642155 RepID=UPI001D3CCE32|nr:MULTISPECIES: HNH endonuclease signature motif containing protein [unclassified Microcoleus]TAE80869.1 MAG: HNH endonuclease [Oscillatoriales cyanobacterium]MCC3407377.1 HNH endonuclease [Microcoleus sp. PH2017_10_PVI_O_A]MCC3461433.1 HNH endonuclease [Microcoleus sp. PH2017_11_PCY_U_A]MCC3479908.1 HNH endonuclease [Microcoleus sp. PH2017_12_PCY_D_A]MCC3560595.1 HNH endonuclease [Microcoleus sp. PH2017_27_LUM_O_A]
MTYISATLRRYIEERASYRCEYCLLGISLSFFPHEVDHIIALKHGGTTDADNLALACWRCNRYKGTDLGSFDPQTSAFSFLFNPRTQNWPEHFTLDDDALIIGLTPEGRTTVNLLQLNSDERLAERRRFPSG